MNYVSSRKSWNTAIKYLVRHGILHEVPTSSQIALIYRSNLSRWKYESESKYLHYEVNEIIKKEIEFI